MNEIEQLTIERVDDIPILLAQLERMQVASLLDQYFPTPGNWQGKCLQVVVQRGENKKPLVAHFGGIPLKRKHQAILVDRHPQFVMTNRSELLQRVLANSCELCGSREKVEVHHIRKLADLEKPGRREKPAWVKHMAARRRKTLIVCRKCHEQIHVGTSTASFRKQGPESRMTQKWSSPVQEGGNGTGP